LDIQNLEQVFDSLADTVDLVFTEATYPSESDIVDFRLNNCLYCECFNDYTRKCCHFKMYIDVVVRFKEAKCPLQKWNSEL